MRTISLLILAISTIFLCSCMSYRKFQVPYDIVEKITLDKFNKNRWTHNGTQKSYISERSRGFIELKHYTWEFPNTKIRCEIEIEALDNGITSVGVYVKNYDSWLYPFNFSSKSALELLDMYEEKLSTNEWAPLPWTPVHSEFDK